MFFFVFLFLLFEHLSWSVDEFIYVHIAPMSEGNHNLKTMLPSFFCRSPVGSVPSRQSGSFQGRFLRSGANTCVPCFKVAKDGD